VDVAVPLGASVEYRRFPLRCKLNGVVIASVHPNGQLARAIHAVGRSKVCCEGDRIVKVGDVNVSRKMETSELASLISELSSRARARGLSACFVQLTCLGTSGLPSKAGVAAPSKKYRKRKTNKDANKYKRVETAYGLFAKSRFLSFRADNPDVPFAAASEMIALEWSAMDENARSKYNPLYEESGSDGDSGYRSKSLPLPGSHFETFGEWLEQRKSDWRQTLGRPELPRVTKSRAQYRNGGPSMTTIRKECRHVLNDVIDVLLTLENAIDVTATGKKFKPDVTQIKINQQVAFQRFVLAEATRRRGAHTMDPPFSLLTDEAISDIGRQWRSMPWSYEGKGGHVGPEIATQTQYGQLSAGEALFVETCQGSLSFQKKGKRFEDHGYLYRQWAALAPDIKAVWEIRGSALAELRKTHFSLAQNKERRRKAKAKDRRKKARESARSDDVAAGADNGDKNTTKKKNKEPKRAVSAYAFFVRDRYTALKVAQPDVRFGQASKVLGSEWKSMKESAKAKFRAMAAADMARYEKETGADKVPKRAKSAYTFFVGERYSALKVAQPELGFGEVSKVLGAQWNAMGKHARAKYTALAAADSVRYNREAQAAGKGKKKE
jgi:hypothetical protein